ncbi:hypothetical protein TYRP_017650 [Tyrophagus putrescentiae]|nr:hypothetical protein TYRP_017650 [Tyrophagus putrescentiae]
MGKIAVGQNANDVNEQHKKRVPIVDEDCLLCGGRLKARIALRGGKRLRTLRRENHVVAAVSATTIVVDAHLRAGHRQVTGATVAHCPAY